MKNNIKSSKSRAAFLNPRLLIAFVLCSVGLLLALAGLNNSVLGTSIETRSPNPVPLINQPLVPDAIAPGGADFTLTVNGTGFVTSSTINWNGAARPTTFVNGSQLTANILASDIGAAGTASVTVVNPGQEGGTSNAVFFAITVPTASVSLSTSNYATASGPGSVAVFDFNRDGNLDLATANQTSSTISILLGQGDGTFQNHVDYAAGINPGVVVPGDFNRDGKVDLVVTNELNSTISVLLGNDDGTFGTRVEYAAGLGCTYMTTADFNKDGNLDLAVTEYFGSDHVAMLLGNGDGSFQAPVLYATGPRPEQVAAGDFNGDGSVDLVVTNEDCCTFSFKKVSILLGNGDGTFQPHVDYTTGSGPDSVTTADFDGDGKLDLVVSNLNDNTVSVLLGNGDGTFQPHVDYSTGIQGGAGIAVAGDFNGDGKLDFVMSNQNSGTISIFMGNGDGTFQPRVDYDAPYRPATGDFNHDGKLDIVTLNTGTSNVSILLQTTTVAQDCTAPPAGVVSWWTGDKAADDLQGTNPGVLKNGASFTKGMVGPAFLFDGVDDLVQIPNSPSLSQTRITLDAWVYPTGNQNLNRHIISKDNVFRQREYSLSLDDVNKFATFVTLPTGLVLLYGNTTPVLNTWYHVAMTHDGARLRLYVNGLLDGILDAVGDIVPTSNPVGIGGNAPTDVWFKGIIDEAQIYDRVLSDAEILAIYQAGADGQCKPEVFVQDISPYAIPKTGGNYKVGTTIQIVDTVGHAISDAIVRVTVALPDGASLSDTVTTDADGNADYSIFSSPLGRYVFKVELVRKPGRQYDRQSNVETRDQITIP